MKKYRVSGSYTITITKEVWANSESEAYDKVESTFGGVTEYCGNGGCDKLVGVDEEDESVSADGTEEWNSIELLEDDPYYFECPNCGEECWAREDVEGDEYWWCDDCEQAFDDDGNEAHPHFEEDEE